MRPELCVLTIARRLLVSALAGTLLACGGGDPAPPSGDLERGEPVRWWSFREYRVGSPGPVEIASGTRIGTLLQEQAFGPVINDFDYGSASGPMPISDPDGTADGQVFGDSTGVTYWAWAQAPNHGRRTLDTPIGNHTELIQYQRFRKLSEGATFKYTITLAQVFAFDGGGSALWCSISDPHCDGKLEGSVGLEVMATTVATEAEPTPAALHHAGGFAFLSGHVGHWDFDAWSARWSAIDFWTETDFLRDGDSAGDGLQQVATMTLISPRTIAIDITSIPVGGEFQVASTVRVTTRDMRQRESFITAFLKDPQSTGGNGVALETTGVVEVQSPLTQLPRELNGPGVIEFTRERVAASESVGAGGAIVTVVRTGGSAGEVSVRLTSADGTAHAGDDYTPIDQVITFADGDAAPRAVRLPLVSDTSAELTETVTLTLSAPTGGATLGPLSRATVEIADAPYAGTFTLGGTISGLVGTGLVLKGPFSNFAPTGNGAFTFADALVDGLPYDVRVVTQPSAPDQVCTVSNGTGTIAGANVTDLRVDCTALAANGALDATFGAGGKVFDAGISSGANAVALQSNGRIVVVGNATLARYHVDGSLDTSFGTSGRTTIAFRTVSGTEAQGVTVQPDDKILVVGAARVGNFNQMTVARYLADGAPDLAFGNGGIATVDASATLGAAASSFARRALLTAAGQIVLTGDAAGDFAVARLNADGTPDNSFNGGLASATQRIGAGSDFAYAAGIQSSGKMVLAGAISNSTTIGEAGIGLARWKTDGRIDHDNPPTADNFGDGGVGYSTADPSVLLGSGRAGVISDVDLAMLADDRFVVATSAWAPLQPAGTARHVTLMQFGASGLACCGTSIASVHVGAGDDLFRAMTRQPDGKLVIVAEVSPPSNPATSDFAVLRFNADLTIDTRFGTAGVVLVDFFGGFDRPTGIAVQPDGRIVVVGLARNGSSNGLAIARLN